MKEMKPAEFLASFLKDRFNLDKERSEFEEIINAIKRGIYFRGTNLWVLIFAVIIASIGLNMNSTAVIIGAMLISPLMGPIMGIGLGAGVNDFRLMKTSFTNYLVAIVISLIASLLYFLITPLNEAHSELLARTTPTVFDVFIALFGGLAGIVAVSSKEKGNVIPGVAIATALIPPLCTAGFGLAVGNLYYFIGALYLFFINSVFICLATFLMVRFLRFPLHHYQNPKTEKRVRLWIIAIVTLAFLPSVYIAVIMVQRNIYENNANRFINKEMTFPDNTIIKKNIDATKRLISVFYIGQEVTPQMLVNAKNRLAEYHLGNSEIKIKQGLKENVVADMSTIKSQIVQELYIKNEDLIMEQKNKIADLENELEQYSSPDLSESILKEARAFSPEIIEASVTKSLLISENKNIDTLYLAYLRFKRLPAWSQRHKLENWLKVRLNTNHVKLVIEK
jgi:uncharacterized hydrophobic protein (TIGR00271 family)